MANKKSIQILRGSRSSVVTNKESLLPGQPVFDKTDNYLLVGQDNQSDNKQPITTNRVIGYYSDISGIADSASNGYSLQASGSSSSNYKVTLDAGNGQLELKTSNKDISINSGNGSLTLNKAIINGNTTVSGELSVTGASTFGTSTAGTLNITNLNKQTSDSNITLQASILPEGTESLNLGSSNHKFNTIYAKEVIANISGTITTSNIEIPGYINATRKSSTSGNYFFTITNSNSNKGTVSAAALQIGTNSSTIQSSTSLSNKFSVDNKGAVTATNGLTVDTIQASGSSKTIGTSSTPFIEIHSENFYGNATTATKIKTNSAIGSATQPVYVDSDGTVKPLSFIIETSVPTDALFTDTTYEAATANDLGLIKIGYSPASGSKNYAVELDLSDQAFVNVPWTDTTYQAGDGISLGTSSNINYFSLNRSSSSGTSTYSVYFGNNDSGDVLYNDSKFTFDPSTATLYINGGAITYSNGTFTI